jgi:hypothetical protein
MPQLMCVRCRLRLHRATTVVDPVGDLCPTCGSLLEPADSLADVVGFRSIRSAGPADADDEATNSHQGLADRIGDVLAARAGRARAGVARAASDTTREETR